MKYGLEEELSESSYEHASKEDSASTAAFCFVGLFILFLIYLIGEVWPR